MRRPQYAPITGGQSYHGAEDPTASEVKPLTEIDHKDGKAGADERHNRIGERMGCRGRLRMATSLHEQSDKSRKEG
jgi:hypothetical protein